MIQNIQIRYMVADNSPGSFRLLRLLLPLILNINKEIKTVNSEHKNKLKDSKVKITEQKTNPNLEKIAEIKAHLVT